MLKSTIQKQTPKSTFLFQSFVMLLQKEARKYSLIEKSRTRKQFHFAEIVCGEWENIKDESFVRDEITKVDFYMECSWWINNANGFPVMAASGETLRRWCEVYEGCKEIPGFDEMKQVLFFDHFQKARWLAKREKVASPALALATALDQRLAADEMVSHFDPESQIPVHEYDKAVGWFDGLQGLKFEWVKNKTDRDKVIGLIAEARKIAEKYR